MDTVKRRMNYLQSQLQPTQSETTVYGKKGWEERSSGNTRSAWAEIPQAPPDAILGITEAFKADDNPRKINLGVGAYRTEEGKPLVLKVVKRGQTKILADLENDSSNLEYLPIAGLPEFNALTARLAFGENSRVIKEGRNATVQSLSGTGSLRVGAEFLAKHYPGAKAIFLPTPTWANHNKIFPLAGIQIKQYRYWQPSTRGLDFHGMIEDLSNAPEGSIVLLHACAHNPTGVDPTMQQWKGILQIVKQKRLLPFFDSAYQGFASGDLEGDAAAIRLFADAGTEMLLAQSYAKNMGLYGERVGALTVVTSDPQTRAKVESQLKATIRPMYSSPPRNGAEIVVTILKDPQLYAAWREELSAMADRIKSMRSQLHQALKDVQAPGTWDHIVQQIGMFSYTGLSKAQVQYLTKHAHVYLTLDGRISMAGLSSRGCRYLAEAMNEALHNA